MCEQMLICNYVIFGMNSFENIIRYITWVVFSSNFWMTFPPAGLCLLGEFHPVFHQECHKIYEFVLKTSLYIISKSKGFQLIQILLYLSF